METLLLDDPVYVHERYQELEVERRKQHEQELLKSHKPADEEEAADEDNGDSDAIERVRRLDSIWPVATWEKQIFVMGASLKELTAQTQMALEAKREPDHHDHDQDPRMRTEQLDSDLPPGSAKHSAARACEPAASCESMHSASSLQEMPMATQLGLQLFSRVCAAFRDHTKRTSGGRMLLLVAPKIPSMLENLPPFPVSTALVDPSPVKLPAPPASGLGPCTLNVFDDLLDIFGRLLSQEGDDAGVDRPASMLSDGDRSNATMAFVAVSLKWGRLRDLVQALLYLVQNPAVFTKQHVAQLHKLLLELARAEPAVVARPLLQPEPSSAGVLVSFGKGDHGKLGHGQCTHSSCTEGNCTENKNVPTVISSTASIKLAKIDSLSTHSIGITTKGEVMAWGNGDKYRLGHGTTAKEYAPRVIDSLSLKGKVTDVACGLGHTIALMANRDIYGWGNGSNGRLGLGDTNDRSNPTKLVIPEDYSTALNRVARLEAGGARPLHASNFRSVICGASHSLALTSDGRVFTWGKNNQGQCGHGHTEDQLTAAEVKHFRDDLSERVVHAAGGWEHTLYCSASGRVYSSGCGYKDSRRAGIPPVLGHGDCEKRLKPAVVQFFVDANEEMVRVACGWDHSLAISAQGALYTWGSGTNGKLGHGDEENCEVPTLVRSLAGKFVKDARAGCEHTVALTDNHELWTFGQGDSGRLGLGDNVTRKSPTLVEFFAHTGLHPVAIAVGDKYNLVLAEEIDAASLHDSHHSSPSKRKSSFAATSHTTTNQMLDSSGHRTRRQHSTCEALKRKVGDPWKMQDLSSVAWFGGGSGEGGLPKDRAELVSFLACHLVRLSTGYMVNSGGEGRFASTAVSTPATWLPFSVDASVVAVEKILQLLDLLTDEKTEQQQQLQSPSSIEKHQTILACLRLLHVNIFHWNVPQRDSMAVEDDDPSALFRRIFDLVNRLASCQSSPSTVGDKHATTDLTTFIRNEAAAILKVGFWHFYPTISGRVHLLSCFASPSEHPLMDPQSPSVPILASVLCEDQVINEIVLQFFRWSATHICIGKDDAVPSTHNSTDQFHDASTLLHWMEALLAQCLPNNSDSVGIESSPKLSYAPFQLLGVLQAHVFAIAGCSASSSSPFTAGPLDTTQFVCHCSVSGLLNYVKTLFVAALAVVKKLHKTACQSNEKHSDQRSRQFLGSILLPAIQATYAFVTCKTIVPQNSPQCSREVQMRFTAKLLPLMQNMYMLLDEISWKAGDGHGIETDPGTNISGPLVQDSSTMRRDHWMVKLSEACAILCGQLMGHLLALPSSCDLWSQVLVLSGGNVVACSLSSEPAQWERDLAGEDEDQNPSTHTTQTVVAIPGGAMLDEERALLLASLEDSQQQLRDVDSLLNVFHGASQFERENPNHGASHLLRCGFVVIAWFTGITSELKTSSLLEINSTAWKAAHQTLIVFKKMLPRDVRIGIASEYTSDCSKTELVDRVKFLVQASKPGDGRLLASSPSTVRKWVSALLQYLQSAPSRGGIHELEAARDAHFESLRLSRLGFTVYNDLLRQTSSPSMTNVLLSKLSQTILPSDGPIPNFWKSPAFDHGVSNLCVHLTKAVDTKTLPVQTKTKALRLWLWVIRCHANDRSSTITKLIADSGVCQLLGEILVEANPVDQANRFEMTRSREDTLGVDPQTKRQFQLSTKLRPVDDMLMAGHAKRTLSLIAHEVYAAMAKQLCIATQSDVSSIHPLLAASNDWSSTVTCDIGSTSQPQAHSSSSSPSPRRRQTLPKKVDAVPISEATQLAFRFLLTLLSQLVAQKDDNAYTVSPLFATHTPATQRLQPHTAFLLASPINVSSSRGSIVRSVRMPSSTSTVRPTPTTSIRAVSLWIYLDQTTSPAATLVSRTSSSIMSLIALGEATEKLSESSLAVPGGSPAVVMDSSDDGIGLIVFVASDPNGSGSLHLGLSLQTHTATQKEGPMPPQFSTFVSVEACQSQRWMHVVISSAWSASGSNDPVLYIDGKMASYRKQVEPPRPKMATTSMELCALSARTQLVCGGSIHGTLLEQMGFSTAATAAAVASDEQGLPTIDALVDDFYVFANEMDEATIQRLYNQGPTIVQVKRQHELDLRIAQAVQLLHEMLQLLPIYGNSADATIADKSETAINFPRVLDVVLRVFHNCSDSASTCTTALVAVEVLKQLVPSPAIAIPSCELLEKLTRCMRLSASHSVSHDLRRELMGFYAFSRRAGVQSSAVAASQAVVLGLLQERGIVDSILPSVVSVDGQHEDDVADLMASRLVLHASVLELLQTLSSTPGWQAICEQFMKTSAEHLCQVILQEATQDNQLPIETVVGMEMASGFSEAFINEQKSRLANTTVKGTALPPPHGLLAPKAPWTSINGPTVSSSITHEWATLLNKFYSTSGSRSRTLLAGQSEIDRLKLDAASIRAADAHTATTGHLQSTALRFFLRQVMCQDGSQFDVFGYPELIDSLLCASVMSPTELIHRHLGMDLKSTLPLRLVRELTSILGVAKPKSRDIMTWFAQDDLEALAWGVWAKLGHQQAQRDDIPPTWRTPLLAASPLESLGGDVQIRELCVHAIQHFPTVRLGRVTITANSGLWYYEALILTDGLMQIGYVDSEFVSDPVQGQGVGDHSNSWAFDGFRCKKWNLNSVDYGDAWHASDIVGVLLDTDRLELSYFLNGKFLGVAFANLPLTSATIMHPAVSLSADQKIRFNFGVRHAAATTSEAVATDRGLQASWQLQLPVLGSPLDQQRLQPVVYAMEEPTNVSVTGDDDDVAVKESESESESGSDGDGDEAGHDSGDDNSSVDSIAKPDNGRITDYDPGSSGNPRFELPGAFADDDVDTIHHNDRHVTRRDSRHDGSQEGDDDDDDDANDSSGIAMDPKIGLIDGLTALGFPRIWARRCAQETSFTVEDSGAVTWILEKMEQEAAASAARTNICDPRGDAGSLDLEQADFTTIPRRVADDMSLLVSHLATSGGPIGVGGRRPWQLSISPTRDGRPHSEQLTRSWVMDSSPDKLRHQEPKSRFTSANSSVMNPFLRSELDDEDDDADMETAADEDCTVSHQFYAVAAEKSLRQRLLDCQRYAESDSTSTSKDSITARQRANSSSGPEDLVPASVVTHSLLSLAYARLIVESVLFDDWRNETQVYLVIRQWVTRDRGVMLFKLLRVQLRLHQNELPVFFSRAAAGDAFGRLYTAMSRIVLYDLQQRQFETESPPFVLYETVTAEIRGHISKALRVTSRLKTSSWQGMSAYKCVALAMNARWTLWLFTTIHDTLMKLSLIDPHKAQTAAQVVLTTPTLVSDVVKLAASATGVCIPWRIAAFKMIKLLLSIEKMVVHTSQHPKPTVPTCCVSVRFLVEFFAKTFKNEQVQRIAFGELTHTLWEIALEHVPIQRSSPPAIQPRPAPSSQGMLCVEQVAATHVTISWDLPQPLEVKNEVDSIDNVVPTEDETDCELNGPTSNEVLSLEVVPDCDRFQSKIARRLSHIDVPRSLPSKGNFVLRHLSADTWYTIRMTKTSTASSSATSDEDEDASESPAQSMALLQEVRIRTLCHPVFELSGEACGSNMVLSNRNRTVKNQVNKKWNTVRAAVAFEEGVHHWHVRIDACVSKNIFIGVATADACLDNYVGSDGYGYGFLANKAVWHNKTKIHSYGEIFKQGDLLLVTLDCTARTLSFSRNGEFLGVAATNLHVGSSSNDETGKGATNHRTAASCKWYPAFSLYNKDDQLTLIVPPVAETVQSSSTSQYASVLELVDSARIVLSRCHVQLLRDIAVPTEQATADVGAVEEYQTWCKWKQNELCWRENAFVDVIQIDGSRQPTLNIFGLAPGDSVFTSRGHCVVLGTYNHALYYEVSDPVAHSSSSIVDFWSLQVCREMVNAPDEYPVHRRRSITLADSSWGQHQLDGETDLTSQEPEGTTASHPFYGSNTTAEAESHGMQTVLSQKDVELDEHLLLLVDAVASHRGFSSPYQLSYTDISSALLLHNIVDFLQDAVAKSNVQAIISQEALLMRISVLFELNQHVYRVVRLFLSQDSNSMWTHTLSSISSTASRGDSRSQAVLLSIATKLAESVGQGISSDSPSYHTGIGTGSLEHHQVVEFLRSHLFATQRDRLIAEALRRTKTPTLQTPANKSSSDANAVDDAATSGEFKHLTRMTIRSLLQGSTQPPPFWKISPTSPRMNRPDDPFWAVPAPGDRRENTLFAQLSMQLKAVSPRELRREVSFPTGSLPVSCTFHVVYSDVDASSDAFDLDSQYLRLLDDVFIEIQSSRFPLFVPLPPPRDPSSVTNTHDDGDGDPLMLDVNSRLLLPEFCARCGVHEDEALLWFFQIGQLFGIVWRARTVVPLQFLSHSFWEDLLLQQNTHIHKQSLQAGDRLAAARMMAIGAVRDGLCSVVPHECLLLSTASSMPKQLSESDVFFMDRLRRHAVVDRDSPHHGMFWSVVAAFSSLERCILRQFLRGKAVSATTENCMEKWKKTVTSGASRPPQDASGIFTLHIVEPLADALDHPDACFPVAHVVDAHCSQLHLPAYSSPHILRQKLLLAMANTSV